jgi:hypothetical protein
LCPQYLCCGLCGEITCNAHLTENDEPCPSLRYHGRVDSLVCMECAKILDNNCRMKLEICCKFLVNLYSRKSFSIKFLGGVMKHLQYASFHLVLALTFCS